MGFLEVLNQKGDEDYSERCREILNTALILHVYICLPDEESLCIEYMAKHGKVDIIEDHFGDKYECTRRFNQIVEILKEDK